MNNWMEISIPCCVRYLSDVTLMTSNYPKMLEIEFSTKRVSWIFNISKIKKPQPLAPYILNDPRA